MRTEDLILVSIDDHVVEPPDMFEQHLAPDASQRHSPLFFSYNLNRSSLITF